MNKMIWLGAALLLIALVIGFKVILVVPKILATGFIGGALAVLFYKVFLK